MPPLEQFHPMFVHFPIVLILGLALFDLVLLARRVEIGAESGAANLSTGLAVLGGLSAIVAFIFGDMAFDVAVQAGQSVEQLDLHQELGTMTAIAVAIWGAVRGLGRWRRVTLMVRRMALVAAVECGLALLVVATAYFGGRLVYDLGIGVSATAG